MQDVRGSLVGPLGMAQDTDMTPQQQGQLFSIHFHLLLCEPPAATSPGCPISYLHSYCTHLLPGPQTSISSCNSQSVTHVGASHLFYFPIVSRAWQTV